MARQPPRRACASGQPQHLSQGTVVDVAGVEDFGLHAALRFPQVQFADALGVKLDPIIYSTTRTSAM
jgi:hypothetical protein